MSEPIIKIQEGSLRGKIREDSNGVKFFSFEGIPYGEPPVGALRFKAPVPVKPWNGIKDALNIKSGNITSDLFIEQDAEGNPKMKWKTSGSEDCLDLNVYTRSLQNSHDKKPRAVMVYIHGGAFTLGNTKTYFPEPLMTEDIVLVTIHYRLGALGFLVLDDPKLGVTGNAGLKDMVLALKWVQRNIEYFNGDPKNVTIFGESAGGAAVNFLMLSPTATGLFHRAIIQSGCSINYWALADKKFSKKIPKILGYNQDDNEENMLKFLQSVPAEKIYEAQLKMNEVLIPSSYRHFSPVVESKDSENPFLTEEPIELLKNGKYNQVPIIIGYNDMETLLFIINDKEFPINIECFKDDALIPYFLELKNGTDEYKNLVKKVRKFYYDDNEPEQISIPTINSSSDLMFIRGLIKTAQHMVKTSKHPVYLYRFSAPVYNDEPYRSLNITGVPHAAELYHLFKFFIPCKHISGKDEIIAERFLKLWTNFAKYGNPTPGNDAVLGKTNWKPFGKDQNFLNIGDELNVDNHPEGERMSFWDDIVKNFHHAEGY